MPKAVLIRGARQLLTLRGSSGPRRGTDLRNLAIIPDGAVLIVNGRIHDVGPSRRLENLALARQADLIDASGRVVMPGFVDSHTHLASGPLRFHDSSAALNLARTIQQLSPRTLRAQALHSIENALRHGTTTMESRSGFGVTDANELKILRVHAALQELSLPLISTFVANTPNLLPLIHRRKLAQFAAAPFGDLARAFLLAAQQLKFALQISAGVGSPTEAIALALELDVSSISHLQNATPTDAIRLAQSQTVATLLPGPIFHLGTNNYPPARTLIDAGVAIALGTGFHPETSPSQSMQMTIALACRAMNMTPAEALSASTINAAHALRLASSIGSLESGKAADLLLLDIPDYRELPYHFGMNLVHMVIKNGQILVERSEVKWPIR
ncbi:MAG TPA: amidohydrolase family protein [Bryobacteraceae bacterium]|nr:amidohydrolase family protein [Bryobacteraceae bacterium]